LGTGVNKKKTVLLFHFTVCSDLTLPENEAEEEDPTKTEEEKKEEAEAEAADGLDSQWNKRMKDRLQKMKGKKMRDMSITVTQKNALVGVFASRQRKLDVEGEGQDSEEEEERKGTGRVREELDKKKGSILFLTGDADGQVEICIQSVMASIKNPTRISIRVDMDASEESRVDDGSSGSGGDEDGSGPTMDHGEVQAKMGRLERDIQTLNNRVKAALNNADYNKEQEAAFHQQSINMNRAATYWPIIQLVILLVTGFTQANHIITYLRTHHIGI
jgi:emp24/gp25L/p24 family/GOLD